MNIKITLIFAIALEILLYLLATSFSVGASSYYPISIERQLSNADVVLYGQYLRKESRVVKNGEIITEVSFKLIGQVGLEESQLFHRIVKVFHPGGKFNDTVQEVVGMPTFAPLEEVVVFLTKENDGLWFQGLAQSKYEIKSIDGERYLLSSLYPAHPLFGKISLKIFDNLIQEKYGRKLNLHSHPHIGYRYQRGDVHDPISVDDFYSEVAEGDAVIVDAIKNKNGNELKKAPIIRRIITGTTSDTVSDTTSDNKEELANGNYDAGDSGEHFPVIIFSVLGIIFFIANVNLIKKRN